MKRNGNNRAMMASKTRIPEGWRLVRLGDVAEANRSGWSRSDDATILYLDLTSIVVPGIMSCPKELAAAEAPSRARRRVHSGDILVSTVRPNLRGFARVREAPKNLIASTGFAVLTPMSDVDGSYVYHHVMTQQFADYLEKATTGQAYPAVRPADVTNFVLPIPPLPEQRSIAAVLDSIDDAIECTEAVIASTEQLRDSLLHELLTRGVPGWHTAWEEVPGLGTMPADWEVVRLGEACDSIQDGDWIESKDQGGQDYRLLQLSNLGVGEFIETGNFRWITQATFDRLNCTDVICGDVLVARMPDPLGRAWYVSELASRSVTAVDIAIVRSNSNTLLPQYLMYQFNSTESLTAMASLATGTTRKRIRRSDIEKLPLALPPLLEQQTIVDLLVSVEGARSHVRQDRQLLQNLKDSTADVLLTGRVRTV